MQIVEKAGEEAEEWLLLELSTLFLMHVRKNQDNNREDLGQVMDFSLLVVDAGCVSVILDDVNYQAGHRIQSLERIGELPSVDALEVAVDAGFCADTEEERGDIFHLQDALLGEGVDEGDERLLG